MGFIDVIYETSNTSQSSLLISVLCEPWICENKNKFSKCVYLYIFNLLYIS